MEWKGSAAALAATALIALPGCGGDDSDDLTAEDSLRDCMTEEGLTVSAADLGSNAALGNAAADFRVESQDGEIADVIVEKSERKANRTSADVVSAKQSFGAAEAVVVQERNAVVVFEDEPAAEFREQVETCL